jgi:quercetin dioxygenase-like cupin family protein
VGTTEAIAPLFDALHEQAARWFLGGRVWRRASSAQTGGTMGVIEQIMGPGLGSPYHVHHNEDESFYILEGETRFFSGGKTWVLGPGGFAFLPRGIAHGFRTEGDVPCRSLLLVTPGGFEDFVAELSSVEPPAGPPDMEALMAAAKRHGLDILGPLPE